MSTAGSDKHSGKLSLSSYASMAAEESLLSKRIAFNEKRLKIKQAHYAKYVDPYTQRSLSEPFEEIKRLSALEQMARHEYTRERRNCEEHKRKHGECKHGETEYDKRARGESAHDQRAYGICEREKCAHDEHEHGEGEQDKRVNGESEPDKRVNSGSAPDKQVNSGSEHDKNVNKQRKKVEAYKEGLAQIFVFGTDFENGKNHEEWSYRYIKHRNRLRTWKQEIESLRKETRVLEERHAAIQAKRSAHGDAVPEAVRSNTSKAAGTLGKLYQSGMEVMKRR